MRSILVFIGLLVCCTAHAQKAAIALEGDHTLKERYSLMKENSQTYSDYKVIKEVILDGVWRISLDTIAALEKSLAEDEASIRSLEDKVKVMEAQVQQKDVAMGEMEFDSSHVTVAGIALSKKVFLSVTGIVFLVLLILVGTTSGALRLLQRTVKEKDLTLYGLNAEFDEFRKKALEKEVKLSRELQSERNKLMEIKGAH